MECMALKMKAAISYACRLLSSNQHRVLLRKIRSSSELLWQSQSLSVDSHLKFGQMICEFRESLLESRIHWQLLPSSSSVDITRACPSTCERRFSRSNLTATTSRSWDLFCHLVWPNRLCPVFLLNITSCCTIITQLLYGISKTLLILLKKYCTYAQ